MISYAKNENFMLFAVILWAVLAKFFAKKKAWQVINIIIVLGMVLAILYLTVFRRSTLENYGVFLTLAQNFGRIASSTKILQTLYLNTFLFFPLGLLLPFALSIKFNKKVLITIIACFVFSACIEIVQGVFCLGDVEIFDLITNVLGAALGCLAYCTFKWFQRKKNKNIC